MTQPFDHVPHEEFIQAGIKAWWMERILKLLAQHCPEDAAALYNEFGVAAFKSLPAARETDNEDSYEGLD